MPNPAATRYEVTPTSLIVYAVGNAKFTFPLAVGFTAPPPSAVDVAALASVLEQHTDASVAAALATVLAAIEATHPASAPTTPAHDTAPAGMTDLITVGPGQITKEIATAVPFMNPGGTILCEDATYLVPFHNPVWDLKIQSLSGNPRACKMDGRGGNGGGHRLAFDKAMVHTAAQLTISGIGFERCGSVTSDTNHSNEAAIYAEEFAQAGFLKLVHVAVDDCANGVFIPGDLKLSGNVTYNEIECAFGYLKPNSQSNPANSGPSHDRYVGGAAVHITGSYSYGCTNGHAVKCVSPSLLMEDCPWIASSGGRAVEMPHGGVGIIRGCALVSRDDGNANFIGVADEDNSLGGVPSLTIDGGGMLIGRSPSQFFIGGGATVTVNANVAVAYFGGGDVGVKGSGSLVGLAPGRPTGAVTVDRPEPPAPPAWGPVPTGALGSFRSALDATFGTSIEGATVRQRSDLFGAPGAIAVPWYIYGPSASNPSRPSFDGSFQVHGPQGDGSDGLYGNYRSRHAWFDAGSKQDVHQLGPDRLTLKAWTGLADGTDNAQAPGNIVSGILRYLVRLRPGSFVEICAKMPKARYAWPAFWLNPGVQGPWKADGSPGDVDASSLIWPPEIDIFDQFGFNDVDPGHDLIMATPTNGQDARFALGGESGPVDLEMPQGGRLIDTAVATFSDSGWFARSRANLTEGFHVFGMDWGKDGALRCYLDGVLYRIRGYVWPDDAPDAHLITSLQIGAAFNDLSKMTDQGGIPDGWDWPIKYVRAWTRI